MRWLVDGYNVIRRDPDLRRAEAGGLEAGRRALLARLAAVSRRTGDRFTVVFDGAPGREPAPTGGTLEVLFSRPPETADDVLRRLARAAGAGTAVVSSDRAVLDAARRARCAAVTADAFLAALGHAAAADARDLDERDEPAAPGARGNPRRPSRAARAADRALRRLRAR